jgi:hypothetical protein
MSFEINFSVFAFRLVYVIIKHDDLKSRRMNPKYVHIINKNSSRLSHKLAKHRSYIFYSFGKIFFSSFKVASDDDDDGYFLFC